MQESSLRTLCLEEPMSSHSGHNLTQQWTAQLTGDGKYQNAGPSPALASARLSTRPLGGCVPGLGALLCSAQAVQSSGEISLSHSARFHPPSHVTRSVPPALP